MYPACMGMIWLGLHNIIVGTCCPDTCCHKAGYIYCVLINPLPTIRNSLKKQKSLYKVLSPSIKPPNKFLLAYGSSWCIYASLVGKGLNSRGYHSPLVPRLLALHGDEDLKGEMDPCIMFTWTIMWMWCVVIYACKFEPPRFCFFCLVGL